MSEQYVIDATIDTPPGLFCFCPIEGDIGGDHTIVTGMMHVDEDPPGEIVAIVHEDGQEAVEKFMERRADDLDALKQRLGK